MLYRIEFEVDNGASYETDVALVNASGFDEAKEKLTKHINSIGSETCVSRIFNIGPFEGKVFTGRHGYSERKREKLWNSFVRI